MKSYKDILNIIEKIENKSNEYLNLLYDNDLIILNHLYEKCAQWLFESEKNNYPKKILNEDEWKIYTHSKLTLTGINNNRLVYSGQELLY